MIRIYLGLYDVKYQSLCDCKNGMFNDPRLLRSGTVVKIIVL